MLVYKPQFDVKKIQPGAPIQVTKREKSALDTRNVVVPGVYPALVMSVSPLKLLVAFFDGNDFKTISIPVDEVGTVFEITPLVPKSDKEEE